MTQQTIDSRRPRPRPHRCALGLGYPLLATLATLAFIPAVNAAEAVDSPQPVATIDAADLEAIPTRSVDDILKTLVTEGKATINIRGRAEIADQAGFETSQAYTVRSRVGFTTGEFNNMFFHIDFEDIRAADDSLYNAAGTNGQPTKTVIADPEDTELNQLFANFNFEDFNTNVRVGRQRVILDDARFVGNVGWRQNEQTFDAVVASHDVNDQLNATYAYIWDINRVFGPDSDLDLDSDSHVIHLSYDDARIGKITGFAYLLSVDGLAAAPMLSSDTYGFRYEATRDLKGDPEGPKLKYVLSWATQSDAGDNTTDYTADYYLIDVKYIEDGWYVGGGHEVLGSDGGMTSFQTPLATGHKFNGWADVFLTTPPDGLEDTFVYLGGDLIDGYKGKVVYHWFDPEDGSRDFGEEIDTVVSKKLSENATVLAKYAYFDGDSGAFADRAKFWFQLTLNY